jgi:acyl dehydratase
VEIKQLAGLELGSHRVAYQARDAILYALAVGASATQLDLVYERDLRVLPTFACALGLWAVEAVGDLGAYDRKRSLHAAQVLTIHRPLPHEGVIMTRGKVQAVWDKGKATILDVAVTSDIFDAVYTIFLPGIGNWGGPPGPPPAVAPPMPVLRRTEASSVTSPNQAALYRLTGDRHPIHIDPEVARANGFERPILHGLCTLGIVSRMLAEANGRHPCDLRGLKARLSAPVMPGESISLSAQVTDSTVNFEANVGQRAVLKGGEALFP